MFMGPLTIRTTKARICSEESLAVGCNTIAVYVSAIKYFFSPCTLKEKQ